MATQEFCNGILKILANQWGTLNPKGHDNPQESLA